MKLLVIGGMHGNEPLGIDIVTKLRNGNSTNVDTMLANEPAIAQCSRYVVQDLNRSFPGNANELFYEARRANEILEYCLGYDLVLDFHNTHCSDNDCTFIGENASPLLRNVSGWLGLRRVIVADYDCLNKFAPNCISVEVSLDSQLMDVDYWVKKILSLATQKNIPEAFDMEYFKFVYRMTLEDKDQLGLEKKELKAFEVIDESLANLMNVASPAFPIFIADNYTPYNFGGLLNKINV